MPAEGEEGTTVLNVERGQRAKQRSPRTGGGWGGDLQSRRHRRICDKSGAPLALTVDIPGVAGNAKDGPTPPIHVSHELKNIQAAAERRSQVSKPVKAKVSPNL